MVGMIVGVPDSMVISLLNAKVENIADSKIVNIAHTPHPVVLFSLMEMTYVGRFKFVPL